MPFVFAGRMGRCTMGVASFGRRPTVDEGGPVLLETFVFDFDDDLYGETCTVSFFAHLRDEEKFDGLEALTVQMHKDADAARAILATAPAGRRFGHRHGLRLTSHGRATDGVDYGGEYRHWARAGAAACFIP